MNVTVVNNKNLSAATESLQSKLSEILKTKGISNKKDGKLESLVEKVELIQSGVEYGEWFPTISTDVLTINGIPFAPAKIGISCESLFSNRIVAPNTVHIALFTTILAEKTTDLYHLSINEQTVFNTDSGEAEITLFKSTNGTYSITISFAEYNKTSEKKFLFRAGLEHMWVISSQEWIL